MEYTGLGRRQVVRMILALTGGVNVGRRSDLGVVENPLQLNLGEGQSSDMYEEKQKLIANDGDSGDRFGHSIAVSENGETIVIGAHVEDISVGEQIGAVYVFTRENAMWKLDEKLVPSDPEITHKFGRAVDVSSDGATLLVGARYDVIGATESAGSAYVFERGTNGWDEKQKLIGASKSNTENNDSVGAAYVFRKSMDNWSEYEKIVADDGESNDYFGGSVDISSNGTTLIVGAHFDNPDTGTRIGSAYVFEQSSDEWVQQEKLPVGGDDNYDYFGSSVSLSANGSKAVVGILSGGAYVFAQGDEKWVKEAELAPSDSELFDKFGKFVTVSGDGMTAVVGAPEAEEPNGERAGTAYVFTKSPQGWEQQQKIAASDGEPNDFFGTVAISNNGGTIGVSAVFDDNENGESAGATYVFSNENDELNAPPIADAGPDQTVQATETVTLDGSKSNDPDGDELSYSWKQVKGPEASLNDADAVMATVTVPELEDEKVLVFELTVSDEVASDTDTVSVTVVSDSPSPLPGRDAVPRDIDDDGVYEDVDGDGEVTLADVELYYTEIYQNRSSEYVQSNKKYFDVTGDGEITLHDVQALFEQR